MIMIKGLDLAEFSQVHDEAAQCHADDNFQRALAAATAAGLENPPMVGIDRRPCTKRPMFVPHKPLRG